MTSLNYFGSEVNNSSATALVKGNIRAQQAWQPTRVFSCGLADLELKHRPNVHTAP